MLPRAGPGLLLETVGFSESRWGLGQGKFGAAGAAEARGLEGVGGRRRRSNGWKCQRGRSGGRGEFGEGSRQKERKSNVVYDSHLLGAPESF